MEPLTFYLPQPPLTFDEWFDEEFKGVFVKGHMRALLRRAWDAALVAQQAQLRAEIRQAIGALT